MIVRSHEVKEDGYEVAHKGRCITVFSAPNYWYDNYMECVCVCVCVLLFNLCYVIIYEVTQRSSLFLELLVTLTDYEYYDK